MKDIDSKLIWEAFEPTSNVDNVNIYLVYPPSPERGDNGAIEGPFKSVDAIVEETDYTLEEFLEDANYSSGGVTLINIATTGQVSLVDKYR